MNGTARILFKFMMHANASTVNPPIVLPKIMLHTLKIVRKYFETIPQKVCTFMNVVQSFCICCRSKSNSTKCDKRLVPKFTLYEGLL